MNHLQPKAIIILLASVISMNYAATEAAAETKTTDTPAASQFKALMEAGKLKQAYTLATDTIKSNPKDPLPHKQLSIILGQLGDFTGAVKEAQTAISLAPKDAEAHDYLAVLYHMLGKPDVAISEYNAALKLDKHNIDAERGHAQCLMDMGKSKEAIADLTKLASDNPKNKDVWLSLSKIQFVTGNEAASNQTLEKVIAIDPNYYPTILFEANRSLKKNQLPQASNFAHRLIELNSQQPIGYLLSASIASIGKGKIDDARFALNQAIVKRPKDVNLFVGLANIFNHEGHIGPNTQTANKTELPWRYLTENALKQAAVAAPDRFDTNMNIAQLLLMEQKPSEAVSYAQKATQIDPKNKDAQKLYQESIKEKGDIAASIKQWFNSLFKSNGI